MQAQNLYLDYLIDPSFQLVNGLFVLLFEDNVVRTGHTECFLPEVEIKDYNVMVNDHNFVENPVNNEIRTHGNIRKIGIHQEDDYTTCCLLNYGNIKENYKLIAIDLRKQQGLNAYPKAIQRINFTRNLERAGNTALSYCSSLSKKLKTS